MVEKTQDTHTAVQRSLILIKLNTQYLFFIFILLQADNEEDDSKSFWQQKQKNVAADLKGSLRNFFTSL